MKHPARQSIPILHGLTTCHGPKLHRYRGLDDKYVTQESCRAWQEQTSARCKITMVKGNHFFIRNPKPDFVTALQEDVLSAIPGPRI